MQKIAPIILLRVKDNSYWEKRNFDTVEVELRPCQKIIFFASNAGGLGGSVGGESGKIPAMGQRQNKTEIVYGDDCLRSFDAGNTPKYLYVRFLELITCPGAWFTPPNDRVFRVEQKPLASCEWFLLADPWMIDVIVRAGPVETYIALHNDTDGLDYFFCTEPGPLDEGFVFHNEITECNLGYGAKGGIATITWGLETMKLMGLLNIKAAVDLFMEMRPLDDGSKVYKYCNLRDATNIAIKYEPD